MFTLLRLPKSYNANISTTYTGAGVYTYRKDQVLECDLDLDPLFIRERRPNEMRLRDGVLVRAENNLGLFVVDMQTTKEQYEARERGVA